MLNILIYNIYIRIYISIHTYLFDTLMTKHKNKGMGMGMGIVIDTKLPFVSVCTPTFNRRPFVEMMIKCFDSQDYPKNKMEWIIIDDGTDLIEDIVSSHPSVKYFKYNEKMTLGKKRNLMHNKACGDIIVYMDDDDYYPPNRVSHAVERLMGNPAALCAGSSEMYIYFKDNKDKCRMIQFGPYGVDHATAGTFAFKRKLLKNTQYNEDACLAEEREFLKNYTVPFVQLDPFKTILVFSHSHNTFDKRTLLTNMEGNPYIRYSSKQVEDFVTDKDIIKFFLEEMEEKLKKYEPGNINMKPDVLKQMKELETKRKEMEIKIIADRQTPSEFMKTNIQHCEDVENLSSQQKQLMQMGQLKELYSNSLRENIRLKEIIDIQQNILDEKNIYIGELETKIALTNDIILVNIEK